jgi:hypothetical protein
MKFKQLLYFIFENTNNYNEIINKELSDLASITDKEHVIVYDTNNKRYEYIGEIDKVKMPSERFIDTVIAIHNHPLNSSFSVADLIIILKIPTLKRASVICKNGSKFHIEIINTTKKLDLYTDTTSIENIMHSDFFNIRNFYIQQKYKFMLMFGEKTLDEIILPLSHDIITTLCKKYNLKYWKE